MSRTILEADWKLFRKLQPLALEHFCQRVLTEINRITADPSKTGHERYLAVFRLLQRQDRELADTFNDMRRSPALFQLARIQSHKLLSEEEMAQFSPRPANRTVASGRRRPTGALGAQEIVGRGRARRRSRRC